MNVTARRLRRARNGRATRRLSRAGVAALLGAGLAASPAAANEVVRNEVVVCTDGSCTDSFEIKCTQASKVACVQVEGTESDPTLFSIAAFGTAPATMLGSIQRMNLFQSASGAVCLVRPGAEGTMKALLTVTAYATNAPPHAPNRSYRLRAECKRAPSNGYATRNTTITRKQNE
jgi:hypothetical protein